MMTMLLKPYPEEALLSLAEYLANTTYDDSSVRKCFAKLIKYNLGISPEEDRNIRYALYIIEDPDGVDYLEAKK